MKRSWCTPLPEGVRIAVQITPNARKTEVVDAHEEALRIKLQAPPIDGRANDALIRHLADRLGVPKSAISITHGLSGRKKLVEVHAPALTADGVRKRLLPGTSAT